MQGNAEDSSVAYRQFKGFHEGIPNPSTEEVEAPELAFRSYKSRFWILGIFSFLALFQCLIWNTWGPISDSATSTIPGWTSATVAMMVNWGTITFVIFIFPMCYLMNRCGLRRGVLFCVFLVALGTSLRCFTFDPTVFTVLCHACAILNGIAGTLVMSAPPLIAATWFPPQERVTATAVGQVFNQFGLLGSYLEPLLVHSPQSNVPDEDINADIKHLMYLDAVVAGLLFFAIAIYYPSKPPSPPSVTSSVNRFNFWRSLLRILRNCNVWNVTLSYGLFIGVPSSWIGVLNYSLKSLNINQDEAMWIGIESILFSGFAALVIGRLTDIFYGRIKWTLIILMIISTGFFYWFLILTHDTIPDSKWQVYLSVICGLSFNYATVPLFMEMAVETAYPCPEILVAGLATLLNNFCATVFLVLFFWLDSDFVWVTYALLSSGVVSVLLILCSNESYSRFKLDRGMALDL